MGDNLTLSPDSYAELSPGVPGSQVTRANATMLGGLAYLAPLQVTNPENGRSVILEKRDAGAGQPLSHTLSGYHYRIDLTPWAERRLGLSGSAIVQVTLLSGPANGPATFRARQQVDAHLLGYETGVFARTFPNIFDRSHAVWRSSAGSAAQ